MPSRRTMLFQVELDDRGGSSFETKNCANDGRPVVVVSCCTTTVISAQPCCSRSRDISCSAFGRLKVFISVCQYLLIAIAATLLVALLAEVLLL